MAKVFHEVRDPIHTFVRLDTQERMVLDSMPIQRLRDIHQLSMTYLVYPGATHSRFEHSLGVMDLASRVFDVITHPNALKDEIIQFLPETQNEDERNYWRRVIRMAALCHDIGHLPFSHTAEEELLPDGWDHERLTVKFIRSQVMRSLWKEMTPPLRTEDIVKLAVGQKHLPDTSFTDWETILSEIIVDDAFGVDRIDYLLRDSHHLGITYGKFDHHRLIDTLRILPKVAPPGKRPSTSNEPTIGIEIGGIHCAESLLLARYFMYIQVYFHPVRRIYDRHLIEFLQEWLEEGKFAVDTDTLLFHTDAGVLKGMLDASKDVSHPAHKAACRITRREHFRRVYSRNPEDLAINSAPGESIETALAKEFGEDNVRRDKYSEKEFVFDFPVLDHDERVLSSKAVSEPLKNIPHVSVDNVFITPELKDAAISWIEKNRKRVLK